MKYLFKINKLTPREFFAKGKTFHLVHLILTYGDRQP